MFDVDESCIGIGIKAMAATAMTAIGDGCGPDPVIPPMDQVASPAPASVDDVTLAGPLFAESPRRRH
jgi:hypothetical protein